MYMNGDSKKPRNTSTLLAVDGYDEAQTLLNAFFRIFPRPITDII